MYADAEAEARLVLTSERMQGLLTLAQRVGLESAPNPAGDVFFLHRMSLAFSGKHLLVALASGAGNHLSGVGLFTNLLDQGRTLALLQELSLPRDIVDLLDLPGVGQHAH